MLKYIIIIITSLHQLHGNRDSPFHWWQLGGTLPSARVIKPHGKLARPVLTCEPLILKALPKRQETVYTSTLTLLSAVELITHTHSNKARQQDAPLNWTLVHHQVSDVPRPRDNHSKYKGAHQ